MDACVRDYVLREVAPEIEFVRSDVRCQQIADWLLLLPKAPTIGVSCRRCGPSGAGVSLVSLSVSGGPTFLMDASGDALSGGALERVWQSAEIVKIFHYGLEDARELSRRYSFVMRNVFDVGIAFDSVAIDCGLPRRRVSLRRLYSALVDEPPAELFEEDDGGHAYWQRRPLTLPMMLEAASGARVLLPLYATFANFCCSFDGIKDFTKGVENFIWSRRPSEEVRLKCKILLSSSQPLARRKPYGILR